MVDSSAMRAKTRKAGDNPLNLYGLDRTTLGAALRGEGAEAYGAGQVFRWLYRRRVLDPRKWTDLSTALRDRLAAGYVVDPGAIEEKVEAKDGTLKYRIALAGGGAVETVCMLQRGRVTLCLSSQVGCALDCDFCLTGKMGFVRHLGPGEIVGQVALIQQDRGIEDRSFNVVFMGMGEPLHNYEGVMAAFRLLTDPEGAGLSRRRITFSTAGLAPAIERLGREPSRPRLAVSLNATSDELRDRLMPINRKYPLSRLREACRAFARASGDAFTFEFVLLDGTNDSDADLIRLAKLVRGHPAKLNLIPFNPIPGLLPYRAPARARVVAIRDKLLAMGTPVSIRWSRGAEARAACGQLALLAPGEGAGPARAGEPAHGSRRRT